MVTKSPAIASLQMSPGIKKGFYDFSKISDVKMLNDEDQTARTVENKISKDIEEIKEDKQMKKQNE